MQSKLKIMKVIKVQEIYYYCCLDEGKLYYYGNKTTRKDPELKPLWNFLFSIRASVCFVQKQL